MNRFGSRTIRKLAARIAVTFSAGSAYAEFAVWAVVFGGGLWLVN